MLISETPKLMRLIFFNFIFLFSSFGVHSYGNDSLAKPRIAEFYTKHFQTRSQISENIPSPYNENQIGFNYLVLGKPSGFQLYQKQQSLKFKYSFQATNVRSGTRPSIADKSSFNFYVINHGDSASKKANVPTLRNEHAGIWKKVGRAELFIGGIELFGMAVLIALPKEITKWSDDWAQDALRNLKRAFTTTPVWDKDDWPLNYIGHPIAGSYYYNALRSQNATRFQSFLFSTAQSFIWEYIIEGVAEKPSTQDLIITPVIGSLLGETTHVITMNMRRNGFNLFEKIFTIIFNPMFAINNGFGPKYNPAFARR